MKYTVLLLSLLALPISAIAQGDDFGIWYSAGAEKKIDSKWSVGLDGEFRTRDNAGTADRWDVGVDVKYKFSKNLKASAGYDLLYDNNPEKTTYKRSGAVNHIRESYWGTRHRFHFDLTGSVDVGQVRLSLRERWQYTYRPSKSVSRYDADNDEYEYTEVRGKGKNVLRSRLQAAWEIPHSNIEPYANVELYNSWSVSKVRYTVGADWDITKHHGVGLYYRYQNVRHNDEENEPDSHIIGVSYKFKF